MGEACAPANNFDLKFAKFSRKTQDDGRDTAHAKTEKKELN